MDKHFDTVKIQRTTIISKKGIEIIAYIAGVNSGAYEFPFCIDVRTWAKKWFWKKFFFEQLRLSFYECKMLRDELNKVIAFYEQQLSAKKDKTN